MLYATSSITVPGIVAWAGHGHLQYRPLLAYNQTQMLSICQHSAVS